MIVLQIFAAIVWAVAVVATGAGCIVSIYLMSEWARGLTLVSGAALRVLAAAAVLAVLIGAPMMMLGWA